MGPARALKFPLRREGALKEALDSLFDERPIDIGGFRLGARGAVPIEEKPTIQGWQLAFQFASATEEAAGFWVGDLMVYGESRLDWKEKLDHAMSVSKLARHTIQNRVTIAKQVTGRARRLAPSVSHAGIVAALEAGEQEELLERARDEEWTTRELTHAVRQRKAVLKGQAPEVYEVVVSVCVSVESNSGTAAERVAWDAVKPYVKTIAKDQTVLAARIVGAKARPK